MNYAATNLSNKRIWMTRQLRKKNLASEIQEWLAAMENLLVAVFDNDKLVVRNGLLKTSTPRNYPTRTSNLLRSWGDGKDAERDSLTNVKSLLPKRINRMVVM